MDLKRIEELVDMMTGRHTFVRRLARPTAHGITDAVAAHANAAASPMFGWQFVKDFLDADAPMPPEVTESPLLRAYCFFRYNARDKDVRVAFELRTKDQHTKQVMLHCMLLSPKYSLAHIAGELMLSEDTVQIYETLFWNVRDRLNDKLYINSLVYPETTQVLWVDGYHHSESPMLLALRAMTHHGLDTVKTFLGIENQTSEMNSESYAKIFEAQALSTAAHSARMGLLHQKDSPAISVGRGMVQASKIGGQVGKDDDSQLGLGSFGLKYPVMDHFKRMSEPDLQHRLLMQQMGARPAMQEHAE